MRCWYVTDFNFTEFSSKHSVAESKNFHFEWNFVKLKLPIKMILPKRCFALTNFSWNRNQLNESWSNATVWKNEKFSLTEKKFREINSLVFSLVKTLLSRKFCQKSVRESFRNFHTVKVKLGGKLPFWQIDFTWNQFLKM